jgi:ABC-type multidrug transport system, ATPase component
MTETKGVGAAIFARGLTKRYGDRRTAVDAIDLSVPPGAFYGFLGPNGAGKSTTIAMLCGFVRPSEARALRVAGVDVTRDPMAVKRHIGVMNEETTLWEHLTAAEHLEFAGQMQGLSLREARRRADELLALLDLSDARDRLIADYSMGMKKKTALAGALIHGPQVLFLDEPFNGVDALSVRTLCALLKHVTEQRGTTVFFTSHVLETVERLCTHAAIIHQGRIVGEGTMDELRARAGKDATLEDAFLRLVEARPTAGSLSWL